MMKLRMKWLALLLAGSILAPAGLRAADSKIGQVDLKKVFEGYYKTKQADAQLKERAGDSEKILKGMLEDYQKATADYKDLVDKANDQAVSADERDKRKKNAENRLMEIQEIERSLKQFRSQTQTTLDEQKKRMRDEILRQIKDIVSDKSKKAGYTLVFDTASISFNQTEVIMYNSGNNDMTDEVLSELNKDAPADLGKPAAETKTDVKPLPDTLNPTKKK
jgi:outer membrane protein